jgi:hypothetical protein
MNYKKFNPLNIWISTRPRITRFVPPPPPNRHFHRFDAKLTSWHVWQTSWLRDWLIARRNFIGQQHRQTLTYRGIERNSGQREQRWQRPCALTVLSCPPIMPLNFLTPKRRLIQWSLEALFVRHYILIRILQTYTCNRNWESFIDVIISPCITTCFGPYGPSSGEYNISSYFYWCYHISLYHNMFRPLRAILRWIQYIILLRSRMHPTKIKLHSDITFNVKLLVNTKSLYLNNLMLT